MPVAAAAAVESADQVVLGEIHKEGNVQEESLVQEEDTSLVERRKACQENQGREGHHDPNCLMDCRKAGTQGVDRRKDQAVEVHLGVVAVVFVGSVVLQGPEELMVGQTECAFERGELVLASQEEDEIHSI